MEDLSIFHKVIYKYCKEGEIKKDNININNDCDHSDLIDENGIKMCLNCGKEIVKFLNYSKEWKNYTDSYSGKSDPGRCFSRKTDDKNIYKDVENFNFGDKIVNNANDIFIQVTNGKTYRGKTRKAIIFACIFHSYKLANNPQSCDTLRDIFNVDRKTVLKGLKYVNLNAPKESEIRTKYITPIELVNEFMDKFNATQDQKQDVIKLYEKIKNKSSVLNRSRPQSTLAGIIYYYICSHNKEITIKEFTRKVKLSELTVNKITKEIEKILDLKTQTE